MRRQDKEKFKEEIKSFYIISIEKRGAFNSYLDTWLFHQAQIMFNISYNTAKRYFYQLVPEEFRRDYDY